MGEVERASAAKTSKKGDTGGGSGSRSSSQSSIVEAGSTAGNSAVAAVLADMKSADRHEAAAIADPRGYVRRVAHSSWDEVRANYKKGLLKFNPAGNDKKEGTLQDGAQAMNHLLWFRLAETLHKDVPNSVMNIVKPEVEDEQRRRKQGGARLKGVGNAGIPEMRPLGWNYGAGSGTATSDIDSNLQGDATEFAVRRFNDVFKTRWQGKESGRVFDVNVYARDYLPETGGGSLFKAKQGAEEKKEKPGALAPGDAWKERGVTFESAALARGSAAFDTAMFSQEVFSLMKTRRDMSFFDWTRYKREQLAGLTGPAQEKKADSIRRAEELYEQREHELAARIALLEKEAAERAAFLQQTVAKGGQGSTTSGTTSAGPGHGADGGHGSDRRLEAENRLYEEKLEQVTRLREDLVVAKARLKAGTGTTAEVEKLSAELTEALQISSMYANEAYVTRATVLHVVGNQQILGAASVDDAVDDRDSPRARQAGRRRPGRDRRGLDADPGARGQARPRGHAATRRGEVADHQLPDPGAVAGGEAQRRRVPVQGRRPQEAAAAFLAARQGLLSCADGAPGTLPYRAVTRRGRRVRGSAWPERKRSERQGPAGGPRWP